MQVTIGVDPRKASHTASAVGPDGVVLASRWFQAGPRTTQAMLRWACQWPDRQWAIEGARGLCRLLAEELHGHGQDVVDMPATATARVRLLSTGHGAKTDEVDTVAVAHVAQHRPQRPAPGSSDTWQRFRPLSDRRDELVQERRRTVNRLHRHLRDLLPGEAPTQLSAQAVGRLLAKARPATDLQRKRKATARDLLNDLRRLDRALADSRGRCA